MIRTVLDTNVLVSGLIRKTSTLGRLIQLWSFGAFELAISQLIFRELERTLNKPYFRQRLTPAQIRNIFRLLRRVAYVVPLTKEIHGIATHPEDDLILATAVSGESDYLVTGDAQLLRLGRIEDTKIVSPAIFLIILNENAG